MNDDKPISIHVSQLTPEQIAALEQQIVDMYHSGSHRRPIVISDDSRQRIAELESALGDLVRLTGNTLSQNQTWQRAKAVWLGSDE